MRRIILMPKANASFTVTQCPQCGADRHPHLKVYRDRTDGAEYVLCPRSLRRIALTLLRRAS